MAASAWAVYNKIKNKIGDAGINLGSDTFKVALFSSSSNVGNSALNPATYANATNELSTANGYTAGGATLASVTWTDASGTETFTSANATWTPTGVGIVARYAVIYDSTSGDLICWSTLDTTPADVSLNGITIASGGIFTIA